MISPFFADAHFPSLLLKRGKQEILNTLKATLLSTREGRRNEVKWGEIITRTAELSL
jgi:hypothetical protein